MSNSVAYIFHYNWQDFSPMLYISNGGGACFTTLQEFCISRYERRHQKDYYLHFEADKLILEFIKELDPISPRIMNVADEIIEELQRTRWYDNCYDEGCFLVNVALDHFGDVINCGGRTYEGDYNIRNVKESDINCDSEWHCQALNPTK